MLQALIFNYDPQGHKPSCRPVSHHVPVKIETKEPHGSWCVTNPEWFESTEPHKEVGPLYSLKYKWNQLVNFFDYKKPHTRTLHLLQKAF